MLLKKKDPCLFYQIKSKFCFNVNRNITYDINREFRGELEIETNSRKIISSSSNAVIVEFTKIVKYTLNNRIY